MKKVGKKKPLISVVVPVYNVENYVGKCLNSILNQTYKNLEIIVVDDGSTDNSSNICRDYAKKDKRIKIIQQKNRGLANARNTGLNQLSGEYVTFIDSDDWIEDAFVQTLYVDLVNHNCDISMVKHYIDYPEKTVIAASYRNYLMQPNVCLKKLLYGNDVDISAWGKLYRTSLFKHIRYPDGKEFEDTVVTPLLIMQSQLVFLDSTPLYHYQRYDKNSITNGEYSPKKLDLVTQSFETANLVKKTYPELTKACDRFIIWAHLATLIRILRSKNRAEKDILNIISYIKAHRKTIIFDKGSSLSDKLSLLATMFGPKFYYFIWKKVYCKIRGK